MSENSNINVGSIEEDIEILNSIVKVNKDFLSDIENQTINQKEIKALEHLLSDYTRQKQINKEHQKINGELRKKVKELEEQLEYDKTHIYTPPTIKLNFIPIQKIVDKIEELKKQRRELGFKTYLRKEDIINDDRAIVCQIQVLLELLQESEDK